MERRNRSLEALGKLQYIDSLEEFEKGESLLRWGVLIFRKILLSLQSMK
jgi:hypothetical protein